jgi:hypothetical protein
MLTLYWRSDAPADMAPAPGPYHLCAVPRPGAASLGPPAVTVSFTALAHSIGLRAWRMRELPTDLPTAMPTPPSAAPAATPTRGGAAGRRRSLPELRRASAGTEAGPSERLRPSDYAACGPHNWHYVGTVVVSGLRFSACPRRQACGSDLMGCDTQPELGPPESDTVWPEPPPGPQAGEPRPNKPLRRSCAFSLRGCFCRRCSRGTLDSTRPGARAVSLHAA